MEMTKPTKPVKVGTNVSIPVKTSSNNITSIRSNASSVKSVAAVRSVSEMKSTVKSSSKHLAYINGPILFTAPHSTKLYRGGPDYGTKEIVHLREQYTSTLVMRWATETGNSFCVWAKENKLNHGDVDPNYMQDSKKAASPFHQALHAFQLKNQNKPLMHVDVHGKFNRKNNFELDLGISCLQVKWENIEPEFAFAFTKVLTDNFNSSLLLSKDYKGYKAICNNEPYLSGYWGCDNLYTMTEQAVDLGIPSFQLEIPNAMRNQLYSNKEFSKAFLKAITDAYENVVKVWWPAKTITQTCSVQIAKSLVEINETQSKNNCESLVREYEKWDLSPPAGEKVI